MEIDRHSETVPCVSTRVLRQPENEAMKNRNLNPVAVDVPSKSRKGASLSYTASATGLCFWRDY